MKRIALCLTLIFSLFFLTSCQDKPTLVQADEFIMLSLDFSRTGVVTQSIKFSVNSEYIDELSNNLEEDSFKSNLIKEINNIRNEFLFSYTLFYIQNPNENFKLNQGLLLTDVTFDVSNDTIGFDIIFTSMSSWNYYHSSSNSTSEKDNLDKGNIFLTKNVSEGVFPFSSLVSISESEKMLVGERYRQKYIESANGLSFYNLLKSEYNPSFIYNYSTSYSNIHSNSNYELKDSSGQYHHVWLVEYDNLDENNSILLYNYTINYGMWYLLALLIVAIPTTIFVCFYLIKEKQQNSYKFSKKIKLNR